MKTVLTPPSNPTQGSTTVTTNLYELIEAVQNEVGPENDELVVATVMYLLRAGRATLPLQHGSKPLQLTSAIRHRVPSPQSRVHSCLATGCILPQRTRSVERTQGRQATVDQRLAKACSTCPSAQDTDMTC